MMQIFEKCINQSTGDYIILSGNDDLFANESITGDTERKLKNINRLFY